MGDIAGDISSKRGQILGTDTAGPGVILVKALVPLSELANYQAKLKSVTAGQGAYSLQLAHYEAVPPALQKQLSEAHAKTAYAEQE